MSIVADQSAAARSVVDAAGELVTLAGAEVLAVVGTVASYVYADSGYSDAELLTLTLATSDMPADLVAGDPARVRGSDYEITEVGVDGAVATLSLR